MAELYDEIGRGYRNHRRPDPRIAGAIERCLGEATRVVNVGAGAGSYEPRRPGVVAVEPSLEMIRQRPPDAAPVLRATAGSLPFRDDTFDAALALLTVHHWPEPQRGLDDLRRATRGRVVLLTWSPDSGPFWLHEYFPEIWELDQPLFPAASELRRTLGDIEVHDVLVPWDCTDGFLGAYWRRPEAYLDEDVRGAISSFTKIDTARGIARLRADLASGEWQRRHGHLLDRDRLDIGYRLVVTGTH